MLAIIDINNEYMEIPILPCRFSLLVCCFCSGEWRCAAVLKRIFFLNESESRILFVIQKISESESESYS